MLYVNGFNGQIQKKRIDIGIRLNKFTTSYITMFQGLQYLLLTKIIQFKLMKKMIPINGTFLFYYDIID